MKSHQNVRENGKLRKYVLNKENRTTQDVILLLILCLNIVAHFKD